MTMHHLVWENLSVELPARKLLTDLNGYAESGRILAIMGPSGSGKSTLLDSLAGRLSTNVKMNGKILIKSKKPLDSNTFSYITQEDLFLGTLTVKETMTYSAHLRLPQKMRKQEIDNIVETIIVEMGLEDCVNTTIGNWHMRGISNGERRRLSIGIEILTQPNVLFIDEPTTGLDSAAACFVVHSLGNIAYNGRIVVCAVHQPSIEVFNLFDDLLLLSNGETIYFGETKLATQFFAKAGFPCPTRRNPSEHFLRCVCLDFDIVTDALLRSNTLSANKESTNHILMSKTSDIRAHLIQHYKNSEFSQNTKQRINEILGTENGVSAKFQTRSDFSRWWKQLRTLTSRSFVNMYRDIGYYWLRMVFYIFIAITIGILFFNLGKDSSQFVVREKLTSFILGFLICLSIGGLPFFIEEMKVYGREMNNGHYGEALLVLSNLLSSLPYLVVITVSSGTIIYWTVNLHPGFSHYAFFCLNLLCCLLIVEAIIMIVASLVSNVLMGVGVGTGIIVFMVMASAIFRPIPDTPKIFWQIPMSYLSFARWAMEGQLKNDMLGLEFDNIVSGDDKLKGEVLLQHLVGITPDQSKWLDLTILFCLTLAHRLLLCVILKYKKKASSLVS